MKKLLLMALAMTCLWTTTHAQVGINTTEPDAILDVEATDSGILIPRVALTAANVAAPITTPTTSELIYNTASAGTGVNAVTPGYYYWSEDDRWSKLGGTRLVYENTSFADPLPYIASNDGSAVTGLVTPSLYTLVLTKPTLVEINIRFDVFVQTRWPVPQTEGFPILYGFAVVNGNLPSGTIICKDVKSHTARPNGNGENPVGSYTLSGSKYVMLPAGSHTFNLYIMGMGGRSDGTPLGIRGFDITVVPWDPPYFQVILHE